MNGSNNVQYNSLVTMTTTHLDQHVIGSVCTCQLYLHPVAPLANYQQKHAEDVF